MEVLEFIRALESGPPTPITLLCPSKPPKAREATFEPFLAEQAVKRATELYLDPTLKDLCYSVYFADEADPRDIVADAQTFPFLAERRIVVVRRAEKFLAETHSKFILPYLESPSDFTLMLLVASEIDKRSKFYKACEKHGQVVPCAELNAAEAAQWVVQTVRSRHKDIRPDAVHALLERTGTRLGDVSNAVRVACDYVGDAPSVTADDVNASCADVAEEQIWALTDAIAASSTQGAVRALREIIDIGTSEFQIMGSINWLLKSAHAIANQTPALAQVSPYVQRKIRPLADKLGPKKIADAFALCMRTEVLFRSTGVDRSLALELLVIKLAAPAGKKAARA